MFPYVDKICAWLFTQKSPSTIKPTGVEREMRFAPSSPIRKYFPLKIGFST